MPRGGAKAHGMSPLAVFIDSELKRLRWSNERAAQEAHERGGHSLSGETVRKARNDLYRERLPFATIRALADALHVTPDRIKELDDERWAFAPKAEADEYDVVRAIELDTKLPEQKRRILIGLYQEFMQDDAEPDPPASPKGPGRRRGPRG